jgi:arylsulfatase A
MDQLAATGVRFENCHVQPLCTPTRVELMTGMNNRANYAHFGYLDAEQTTFAHLLKQAGYATCVVGKWQLGNGIDGPQHFGFDEYCLWQLVRRPGRYKNPGLEINGKQFDYTKNEYGPDLVHAYAEDFITRKKDEPFFLYYPMMLTHLPYDATPDSPDYLTSISGKNPGKLGHFPDMVAYTDKVIGKLVAKLEALGLRENTMLLILGDNGTGRGTPSKFRGRDVVGGKGTSTDWGTHVSAICNWPNHWASGKVSTDLIAATDFLPTICEAAGASLGSVKPDGRSFLPQLRGETGNPRSYLYCWYNPSGGPTASAEFVHTARYKLYSDGRFFRVDTDDLEKSPLKDADLDAEAKAEKARLQAALATHLGPRDPYFANQGKPFGGESGEDANGNKVPKGEKKKGKKPATP